MYNNSTKVVLYPVSALSIGVIDGANEKTTRIIHDHIHTHRQTYIEEGNHHHPFPTKLLQSGQADNLSRSMIRWNLHVQRRTTVSEILSSEHSTLLADQERS